MYRMMAAMLIALGAALLTGPRLIAYLRKLHFGQTIYELGKKKQKKQGTPVMGGLMIALGVVLAAIVCHPVPWRGLSDPVWPLLGVALLSMAVGFADDYIKAVKKRHDGLQPMQKILGQVLVAAAFSVYCYASPAVGSGIWIPILNRVWDLGFWYIPLMTLLIIFMVNSTNLQDGLDGLLSTVTVVGGGAWAVICALLLLLPGIRELCDPAVAEVAGVVSAALIGGCIGFLRFNRYPAKTFMGDTGSMLIGGTLVGIGMMTRMQVLLVLTCLMPIVSSFSVILQRYYFKLTHGKRIFLMSPVHHHFEKKGYSETQIVSMYAGVTMISSLIAVLLVCAGPSA